METAISSVTQIVRTKYFWWAVIAIIVFFVIKKNWYRLSEWSAPSWTEPTTNGNGQPVGISQARRIHLRELASNLHNAIYSILGWSSYATLEECAYIPDEELKYTAEYYKSVLNKNQASLYEDLDGEYFFGTQTNKVVLNRLKQMGLQ